MYQKYISLKMDDFIKKWAEENELSEDTIHALQDKGFKSQKSPKLLNEQTIRKEFGKDFNPAQMLLVISAVEQLKQPVAKTTDMSARRDFDDTFKAFVAGQSKASSQTQVTELQNRLDAGGNLSVDDIAALLGGSALTGTCSTKKSLYRLLVAHTYLVSTGIFATTYLPRIAPPTARSTLVVRSE